MRRSRALCTGTGDVFEKWVSRSQLGSTASSYRVLKGEGSRYLPQMLVKGSPYPKFPARFGIPRPDEAIVPERKYAPWERSVEWADLTPEVARQKETALPGVLFHSELPQDPVDRLFFQVKPQNAELLATGGRPDNPEDYFEEANAYGMDARHYGRSPLGMMALALDEQKDRRERFITVKVSDETLQIGRLLLDHGLIAGLRDYNNGHKFSIETKWWDNLPAVTNCKMVSIPERARLTWGPVDVAKVMYFNKVYNVIRLYFIRLADGEIVTHPEAHRRGVGGEPLLFVD